MKIKWTSIHRVLAGNPIAPWVGPSKAERAKRETRDAKEKQKTERDRDNGSTEGGRK